MSLVLFEPNYTGHRYSYCARLIAFARRNEIEVVLATSEEGVKSSEFSTHLLALNPEVHSLGPLRDIQSPGYHRWARERLALELGERSRVVVLEGDKLAPAIGISRLRFRGRLTVLVMRAPTFDHKHLSAWLKNLGKAMSMWLLAVRGAHVVVLAPAQRRSSRYRVGPWRSTPDPIDFVASPESIDAYRRAHDIDESRKWFGMIGRLTPRKSLGIVLAAFAEMTMDEKRRTALLIAGDLDESEVSANLAAIEMLRVEGIRIEMHNAYLDDAGIDSAVASVDCLVVAHSSEGPSGILGKAAAAGRPVVTAGAISLREDVERLRCGLWSRLEPSEILANLRSFDVSRPVQLAGPDDFSRELLFAFL